MITNPIVVDCYSLVDTAGKVVYVDKSFHLFICYSNDQLPIFYTIERTNVDRWEIFGCNMNNVSDYWEGMSSRLECLYEEVQNSVQ